MRTGDVDTDAPRAWVPGVLHIPQSGAVAAGLTPRTTVAGSGEMAGRTLLVVGAGNPNTSGYGAGLIDITGPWRA